MKSHLIISVLFLIMFCSCKEKQNARSTESETKATLETQVETEPTSLNIIPVEHASIVLELGEQTIFVDPSGNESIFVDNYTPTIILITDIHGDHLNLNTLNQINTTNTTLIVPQAVADKLPKPYTNKLVVLNNGDSVKLNSIEFQAIPMYNLREEALKFHTKGRGNGYIINFNEQRIYISGDTEDIPEMRELRNIDKAFICMNLPYTMTVESAASAVIDFKPKQVFPYHYRGTNGLSDIDKFKTLVNEATNDIDVIQFDWYPEKE